MFSLPRVVPCFPLLGLTTSGLFMGLKCLYGQQGFYSYGSSILCKKVSKKKKIGF